MLKIGAYVSIDGMDDQLAFLKQYGIDDVVANVPVLAAERRFPPDATDRHLRPIANAGGVQPGAHWEFMDAVNVRNRYENAGLRVTAMENPLPVWCMDRIILGLPGRDQQIDNYITTIRNLGRAGIRTLGYGWMPNYVWRTTRTARGRGGAQVSAFDLETAARSPSWVDREYTEGEMWEYYRYFVAAVMPVCEAEGVRLALHPDDPPVERLGGIPRLFRDAAAFDRALEIAASPMSGLDFCLGNWAIMANVDLLASIRQFGDRIYYGHVQAVQGAASRFEECFLDEASCDFLAVIETLNEVGFDGTFAPAHLPRTTGDTDDQRQGDAYAFGYLKGLARACGASVGSQTTIPPSTITPPA